jgi:hypothetical protein
LIELSLIVVIIIIFIIIIFIIFIIIVPSPWSPSKPSSCPGHETCCTCCSICHPYSSSPSLASERGSCSCCAARCTLLLSPHLGELAVKYGVVCTVAGYYSQTATWAVVSIMLVMYVHRSCLLRVECWAAASFPGGTHGRCLRVARGKARPLC